MTGKIMFLFLTFPGISRCLNDNNYLLASLADFFDNQIKLIFIIDSNHHSGIFKK